MPSSTPRRSGPPDRTETPPPPAGAADPLVGRVIAGHQVLQCVATGRLCSTYKANHTAMGRTVALKVLSADADPNTIARFHQTARHAAQLHHANVASIYDVNTDGGVNFCAMEFVEGQSLGELFRAHTKVPSADAIRVAIEVAEALRFGNAREVPGWRLSANRVVITRRGEVKLLPPSFAPPGAPVLDDAYVIAATGVLLYAMLTGGRVHDIEYALEPGSKAPKQLEPIRGVATGLRRDVAAVVERLLGVAGEPSPSAEAALSALRGLLAAKEQSETRSRKLSDSARARSKRTRTSLFIALGAVAAVALIIIAFLSVGSSVRSAAEDRFNAMAKVAADALRPFAEEQRQFLASPSDARARQARASLEKARAVYAAFARDHPNQEKGRIAEQTARGLDGEIAKFDELVKVETRFAEGRAKVQEVNKELEAEIARRIEQGGQIDAEAWRKRYLAVRESFLDSPKTAGLIDNTLSRLPQRVLDEQLKIDSNAVANEVLRNFLPNNQFGKALEAWQEHRRKYNSVQNDAMRRKILDEYTTHRGEINQAARVKWHQLDQQAKFHVKNKEYEKARRIYNQVIQNFGIAEFVDKATEELAKMPAQ